MKQIELKELKIQRIEDIIKTAQPKRTFVLVGNRSASGKEYIPGMISQLKQKLVQVPNYTGIQIIEGEEIFNNDIDHLVGDFPKIIKKYAGEAKFDMGIYLSSCICCEDNTNEFAQKVLGINNLVGENTHVLVPGKPYENQQAQLNYFESSGPSRYQNDLTNLLATIDQPNTN